MPIRRIHEQGNIENIADTRRPEARENSAFLLLRLGCVAAFLVVVLCSAHVIAEDKHEIWGRVYSEVTGEGIENLQIYCSTWGDVGPRGTTGADGLFAITVPHGYTGWLRADPINSTWRFEPYQYDFTNVTTNLHGNDILGIRKKLSISGHVRDAWQNGVGGISVMFDDGAGTRLRADTNSSGYYSIEVPRHWSGTADPLEPDATFNPETRSYDNVTWHQYNQDYTVFLNFRISGFIRTTSGVPVGGVGVRAVRSPTTTDSAVSSVHDGYYSLLVPQAWTGVIEASVVGGYTFQEPRIVSVTNVQSDQIVNFTCTHVSDRKISGYVLQDGVSAIKGVTISFSDGETVTSNNDGYYEKGVAFDSNSTVTPSKEGYVFTPSNRSYLNVREHLENQNFSSPPPKDPLVAGYVRTADSNPVGGVTMTFFDGDTVRTSTYGFYSKRVAYDSYVSITPSKIGFLFEPTYIGIYNVRLDKLNQNFEAIPAAVIEGYIRDESGIGIKNVNMVFDNNWSSVRTDDNGYYLIQVVIGWSGTVTPRMTGYAFNPESRNYNNLTTNRPTENYTGIVTPVIYGFVYNDNPRVPLGGVTMTLSNGGGTATTFSSGQYMMPPVWVGFSGTLTPSMPGFKFVPESITLSNVTSSLYIVPPFIAVVPSMPINITPIVNFLLLDDNTP
jgi:hypothetical protein